MYSLLDKLVTPYWFSFLLLTLSKPNIVAVINIAFFKLHTIVDTHKNSPSTDVFSVVHLILLIEWFRSKPLFLLWAVKYKNILRYNFVLAYNSFDHAIIYLLHFSIT